MSEKILKTYETDDLIIYWRPDLCEHACKCISSAPEVFNVNRRPWVMPENGKTEDIARIIDECPSEALTYKLKKDIKKE